MCLPSPSPKVIKQNARHYQFPSKSKQSPNFPKDIDTETGMATSLRISPEESVVITVSSTDSDCSSGGEGIAMVSGIRAPSNEGNAAPAARLEEGEGDARAGKEREKIVDLTGGEENVCRICHLSSGLVESEPAGWELVQIGCACKGELGRAHRCCAEAWFRVKRSRFCEICGLKAENISGREDSNFMELWNEGRSNLGERGSRCSCKSFCGVLSYFLVGAFTLVWLFKPD